MSYYEITFKIQHTKNTKKIRKINSEDCHKRKRYHRNQANGHYCERETIRERKIRMMMMIDDGLNSV